MRYKLKHYMYGSFEMLANLVLCIAIIYSTLVVLFWFICIGHENCNSL